MRGVLNTNTGTVHKQQIVHRDGAEDDHYRAPCGSLAFLPAVHLEVTSVEEALDDDGVCRCGTCFEGGGGY